MSIDRLNSGTVGGPLHSTGAKGAQHTGLLGNANKTAWARVKPEKEQQPEERVTTTAPPPASEPTEFEHAPGIRGRELPDGGGTKLRADSGLEMVFDSNGDPAKVRLDDGVIQGDQDGKPVLTTPDGQAIPVEPLIEKDQLVGFSYERPDKTKVTVDVTNFAVSYENEVGDINQVVAADGTQYISTKSGYRSAKGQFQDLKSDIVITPDGEVSVKGWNKDLEVSAGEIKFKNPSNHTHILSLPVSVPSLRPPEEAPPQASIPADAPELPRASEPLTAAAPPVLLSETPRPAVDVTLPSQTKFKRLENGDTLVQLRDGRALLHTADRTIFRDTANEVDSPVEVGVHQNTTGRSEKMFRFADVQGNRFTMFDESMDFLVESPDGRVRQHVLPDGTIMGVVQTETGPRKFEITPEGAFQTDRGLSFNPLPGQDMGQVTVYGQGGPPVAVPLPYPVPFNQPNAAYHKHQYGEVNFPQSGIQLPGFQAPPPPPGVAGPQQVYQDPYYPGGPTYYQPPSYMPHPGQLQQPVKPGLFSRFKYWLTGNPEHLQPKRPYQPPHFMGGYPTGGYPVAGHPIAGLEMPGYPHTPPGSYGPGAPGGGYHGLPAHGGAPGYPGYSGHPGFTGLPPHMPGQPPNTDALIAQQYSLIQRQNRALDMQAMAGGMYTNNVIMSSMMQSFMPMNMWLVPYMF